MGEANRRGSFEQRRAEANRSGTPLHVTPAEFARWVDKQTRKRKPAVTMVQPEEPGGACYAYLANADAFAMPVLAALSLPRDMVQELGSHIEFLHQRHTTGHPVTAGQNSAHELDDGVMLRMRITEPPEERRRSLLAYELRYAGERDPNARVLLLEPEDQPVTKHSVH